jgi:hypothetical protein
LVKELVENDFLFITLVVGSSLSAGGIFAIFLPRLINKMKWSYDGRKLTKVDMKAYDSAKIELRSLYFEKNLVTQIIAQIYNAIEKGEIDKLEADRLLLKYNQDLESYNNRAAQLEPTVEFAEINHMRNGLVSLIEERISSMDEKLNELSKRIGTSYYRIGDQSIKRHQVSKDMNKNIAVHHEHKPDCINSAENRGIQEKNIPSSKEKVQNGDTEKQHIVDQTKDIKDLQNKISESLKRLDQVNTNMDDLTNSAIEEDLDKDNKKMNISKIDKKRDALANLYS